MRGMRTQKGHNICTCTWDTLFGLFRSGSLSLPLSLSLRGAHHSPTQSSTRAGPTRAMGV